MILLKAEPIGVSAEGYALLIGGIVIKP